MILNLILDQPGAWKYAGCKLVRPVGILNVAQNNLTFDLPHFFWRKQTWVETYSKNSISRKKQTIGSQQNIQTSECYEHLGRWFTEMVIYNVILFDLRQWNNSGWPLSHMVWLVVRWFGWLSSQRQTRC